MFISQVTVTVLRRALSSRWSHVWRSALVVLVAVALPRTPGGIHGCHRVTASRSVPFQSGRRERPQTLVYVLLATILILAAAGLDDWCDEDLCRAYRETGSEMPGEILLQRYRARLWSMARGILLKTTLPASHIEDVYASMRIALVAAVRTYDCDRGAVFAAFLYRVAIRSGWDYVRDELRAHSVCECSLDACEIDQRDALLCRRACPYDADCRQCGHRTEPLDRLALRGAVASLSPAQQSIIGIVASGGTEGDIMLALGCTRDAARVNRNRTLRRMRALLTEDYRHIDEIRLENTHRSSVMIQTTRRE